jgi:hypothetical protein
MRAHVSYGACVDRLAYFSATGRIIGVFVSYLTGTKVSARKREYHRRELAFFVGLISRFRNLSIT